MNIRELRELSDEKLADALEDQKEGMFNLRFQKGFGQLEDPNALRRAKRDIAPSPEESVSTSYYKQDAQVLADAQLHELERFVIASASKFLEALQLPPRRLEIEGSTDGTTFTTLHAGPVIAPLALSLVEQPVAPRIDLALPPTDVRVLRLRQTGRTPRQWYWSVHEIRVWEER